jgi:hypothetical protein
MRNMNKMKIIRIAGGALFGAAVGLAYWKLVGCSGGYCPISSNPWLATGFGAAIGFLLGAS